MAQTVKRLRAMRESRVFSLDGEDPLEKEMATHSSILAWKIQNVQLSRFSFFFFKGSARIGNLLIRNQRQGEKAVKGEEGGEAERREKTPKRR